MRYGDLTLDQLIAKKKVRKAVRGGGICWRTLFINFIHQSFLYLDRTERMMRVFWEIVPATVISLILYLMADWPLWIEIIVALALTHALNWIFNNNFWNCLNCAFSSFSNRGTERTLAYLNQVRTRLEKHSSISGIMFLGSLSRFQWHDRSDIDMRILRRPGFRNGIVASLLTSRERVLAVFAREPMDLYLADSPEFLKHHRADERPIFTLRRDERITELDFPGKEVPVLKPETFNIKI